MNARALVISDRAYQALARAYPPGFRRRFANEMAQVFRWQAREAYQQAQLPGLLRLWLPAAWDWAWTAVYQWLLYFLKKGRSPMDTAALDHQMSDLIWSMSHGLRAGYSLRQVFEMLAKEAPEPARTACQKLLDELQSGASMEDALQAWKTGISSTSLGRLVDVILAQRKTGGNLADLIDPLGEAMLHQAGSDPAFYASMRRQSAETLAPLPERVKATEK